jgi:hypothetical protein
MAKLREQLAWQADFIVNNLVQTDYQHNENINADEGIYDCDCSEFVGFVLQMESAPALSTSKLMLAARQPHFSSDLLLNSKAFRSPSAGLNRSRRCLATGAFAWSLGAPGTEIVRPSFGWQTLRVTEP